MDIIMQNLGYSFLQAFLLLAFAPLITGIIKKVKARLQNRIGSSIFQEYLDVYKWWRKPTILTPETSIIFIIAPFVYFATTFLAALMLPNLLGGKVAFGDVFVFVYILAIGRFFMALSSMDAATAFGGMGGSREIYISVLVEPAIMLAILSNLLRSGSTMLGNMAFDYTGVAFSVATVLTCIAFFAILIAENSRIPVDNPDTHLELTMIHECMLLEYSGRLLSLIHLTSMFKLAMFLVLFSMIYLPIELPLVLKVLLSAVSVSIIETLNNKMRLFKVPVYIATTMILLVLAIVAQ